MTHEKLINKSTGRTWVITDPQVMHHLCMITGRLLTPFWCLSRCQV